MNVTGCSIKAFILTNVSRTVFRNLWDNHLFLQDLQLKAPPTSNTSSCGFCYRFDTFNKQPRVCGVLITENRISRYYSILRGRMEGTEVFPCVRGANGIRPGVFFPQSSSYRLGFIMLRIPAIFSLWVFIWYAERRFTFCSVMCPTAMSLILVQ